MILAVGHRNLSDFIPNCQISSHNLPLSVKLFNISIHLTSSTSTLLLCDRFAFPFGPRTGNTFTNLNYF